MDDKRDQPWLEAFQEAPLAMVLLVVGTLFGAGGGVWLLVTLLGFDETPAIIAGPVIAGTAIAGGLAGVLIAAIFAWGWKLVRGAGRGSSTSGRQTKK